MKKSNLVVGILCIFMGAFLVGCNNQPATSSTEPETVSEDISSEKISSENISSSVLQSSDAERNNKEIILYAYSGMAPTPTDHKLARQLPKDTKEIQETVKIPAEDATPDKIMKLYVDKYLTAPVANGSKTFSYASVTMNSEGIITIDFTKEGASYLSYGTMLESNTLYGIGKTMLMNVEGAKSVCYGIEGGDYQTEMVLKRSTPYLTK
jgi:hypothetical protein